MTKLLFFIKNFIFDQKYYFWAKFSFSKKNTIFDKKLIVDRNCYFSSKILIFVQNYNFSEKFRCQKFLIKILIFGQNSYLYQNFNFRLKLLFLIKILIFDQSYYFWSKFQFLAKIHILTKILIFDQSYYFWAKFLYSKKMLFLGKIIVFKKYYFWLKFSTKLAIFDQNFQKKKLISYCQLTRTPLLIGKQNDPITLYSEFGYGKLEMFILAPAENALLDFRKKWPKGEKIDMGAASAAILLVFRIWGWNRPLGRRETCKFMNILAASNFFVCVERKSF